MDNSQPPTQAGNPSSGARTFLLVLLILALFIGIGAWYFFVRTSKTKVAEVVRNYNATTVANVDFLKASRELETAVNEGTSSKAEESLAKILLADSLAEVDRVRSIETLKDVILDESYPAVNRALAINLLTGSIDLDFIERDFLKKRIFTGDNFGSMLTSSGGSENLAMRKLNEKSQELFPNVITSYQLARWYAAEFHQNPQSTQKERDVLLQKTNEYLNIGDELFGQYGDSMQPMQRGTAFESKARVINLSGGDKNEAKRYFELAMAEFKKQPQTIFQIVHMNMTKLYFSAFLAKYYGASEVARILHLLRGNNDYLLTAQEPAKRNVRFVSFLVAARDSQENGYPASDFDRDDIERIGALYPDFKATVDKLDLKEYVKGHPLENQIP